MNCVGLLPAAGQATRIHGIPKYLLPVPGGHLLGSHVAQLQAAGAAEVLVGCSLESQRLVTACAPDVLSYVVRSHTMSETVRAARDEVGDRAVLFGMPDTYWAAPGVYDRLRWMLGNDIDVAVACWAIRDDQRGQVGQVALNGLLRLQRIVDKDPACTFPWLWGALAWKPCFWDCIDPATPHVGYAVAEALRRGLKVFAYPVEGEYYDCGTFDQYARLCATLAEPERVNG